MKNIIVREYLESLTERDELDYIFPILLDVMGFKIISTPKQTKGLAQYGKDVVAIGVDDTDGVKKRFYFEVKGGADRHVTTTTYSKNDGIRESIYEAKDRPFRDSSNPDFNSLPVKIVLVHNGELHASVKETFDGLIEKEFQPGGFERWDIFELTKLFTTHLFNEYLLPDDEAIKYFKKVLVLINAPGNDFGDYYRLIHSILEKAGDGNSLAKRKRLLLFETLNLISFIIYSYSQDAKNLEPAKHCLSFSALKLWNWILRNNLEKDPDTQEAYKKHVLIYIKVLREYFTKTLPVARLQDGLWSSKGGRFEQIGYPMRTFEYLNHLLVFFELIREFDPSREDFAEHEIQQIIADILNNNRSATRPMLDNHSITVVLIFCFLLKRGHVEEAKVYLRNLSESIKIGHRIQNRLPDGHNQIESVIRFIVTGKKSIYYQDKTSHLLAMVFEFMSLLDMGDDYRSLRAFVLKTEIDLGLFIPYSDAQLKSAFPDDAGSHELLLFDHQLQEEGYQSEVTVEEDFEIFKSKTKSKNEFTYNYRTESVGFSSLLLLAHVSYKTPVFTLYWRPSELAVTTSAS